MHLRPIEFLQPHTNYDEEFVRVMRIGDVVFDVLEPRRYHIPENHVKIGATFIFPPAKHGKTNSAEFCLI